MKKLQRCRICLVENVRMYTVANKSLQETYERLSDVPFVTEDSRPMVTCFYCCAKLKQCCQLQRKCVQAEKLFAQMLSNCELNSPTNRVNMEYAGGFVKTPIEIISIVDDRRSEADANEIELPAAAEHQHAVLEIKVERQSDDFGPDSYEEENSRLYVEDRPPQQPASDSEDDIPLVEMKSEVEGVKERLEEIKDLEPDHQDASLPEVVQTTTYLTGLRSEESVPLVEVKTEIKQLMEKEQEVSKKKPTAKKARRAPVTKKTKLKGDTPKQKKNGRPNPKNIRKTDSLPSASINKSKGTIFNIKLAQKGANSVFNLSDLINTIDTNFGSKSDSDKIINSQSVSEENAENVKDFKCDVCDRRFSDKGNLRRHVIAHGEAPFKCHLCQRGFHAKSHLAKHIRTHTGERPFECDECHRCFSERSNLIKHLRRHTGDKPYKCDVCQRSFNQKYHLQSHSLVHTGEKPFKCDVCQQGFNLYLSIHIINL